MKNKALLRIILLLIIFTVSCIVDKTDSIRPEIDSIFAEWDKPDSPGCAFAVVKDGEIVYRRGYGMANLEHGVPITTETVFYIGSESKQFVTMCLLLLMEEGKLSLDDNIRKYVPEIPEYDRPITIRHLIYHTSGLRDYFTLWSLAGIDLANYIPEGEVIDLISRQKELNFLPGEERLYSNSGYLLLSVIIKRVSGKSFKEYADEKIFKPLGMNNSHFHDDPSCIIKNRADGYNPLEGGKWGNQRFRFALTGSGGLYTTVGDLFLWDQNFYNNRLGRGDQGLIELMLTKGKLNSGEEFNYAFALVPGKYRGLKTVRHGGALGGYRSHVLRFPKERFTVILLFNLSSVNPGRLAEKVSDIYLAEALEPQEPEKSSPERAPAAEKSVDSAGSPVLSPGKLKEYSGEYISGELLVTYRISVEDNKLFASVKSNPSIELKPAQADVFTFPDMEIVFKRNSAGRVNSFLLNAGRVKNLRFEKEN